MSFAFSLLEYRISMVFLLSFLLNFLPLRYSRRRSLLIAGGCFLLTFVLDYFSFLVNKMPFFLASVLLEIVAVQLTAYILCEFRDFRALFTGFCSASYVLPGNLIAVFLFLVTGHLVVPLLVQITIHELLLVYLLRRIRTAYLGEMQDSTLHWGYLCSIPALFYLIAYTFSVWPQNVQNAPANIPGILLFLVLMIICYIMLFSMSAQRRKDTNLSRDNEYLSHYADHLRHETAMMQAEQEKTTMVRHDMRHYILLAKSYLEAGETIKLQELLEQEIHDINAARPVKYCENVALNGVISDFQQRAAAQHILFVSEAALPRDLPVNEFEFATVISNLLENALQATAEIDQAKARYVKIKIRNVNDFPFVEISNTFAGTLNLSPTTGFPISYKGSGHGYGMRSIQAFADKNNAVFDYKAEDGVFLARLLLQPHPSTIHAKKT